MILVRINGWAICHDISRARMLVCADNCGRWGAEFYPYHHIHAGPVFRYGRWWTFGRTSVRAFDLAVRWARARGGETDGLLVAVARVRNEVDRSERDTAQALGAA